MRIFQVGAYSQPVWYRPHTQTVKGPVSRLTNKHSQLETFSQPCCNRIFSNCLSHNSPAKGWPYRFRSRGPLDLPYWTMIWAICALVDVSKCLDTPILEFSITSVHLPFLPGYKQILRPLLVHRNPAIWRWYPWLLAAVIWDAEDPCSVNTAYDPESSFTMSPRSTTLPFILLKNDVPTPNSWNDRDPSMTRHELFYPCSLLLRSPLCCFWLLWAAMPAFCQSVPIIFHCCLCIWNFKMLEA